MNKNIYGTSGHSLGTIITPKPPKIQCAKQTRTSQNPPMITPSEKTEYKNYGTL